MTQPPAESAPQAAATETSHDLGQRARSIAAILWSAFLAAALATMLCFAFIDPEALASGDPPGWWTTRLHVYAVGFFFWSIGLVAAALCWQLSRGAR